jgi:CHAD domain-containing protein
MSEEPHLRPDAPVGPALIAIGRALLARISMDKKASESTFVHDFRRGMKRWRAFLRLLEPMLGEDATRLRHEARDLARTLAGARDAQAALDALSDLGGEYNALTPSSHATVVARIEELRARAESATMTPETRDKLHTTLAATADKVEHWPLDKTAFKDVAASLADGYRRARRAVPPDWSGVPSETLHALRQRVVVHRYQMEIVEPLWPRLGRVWVGEAQRLRERLGKEQDLTVLERLTASKHPLARWRPRLLPAIEARKRDHIEAAMRHAKRLFAEKPAAFQRRIESMW